jgi:uncharacterized membrane protein YfcA
MHLGDHVRLLVKQRNGKCFGGKEEIMIYIVLAVGALIAGIVTAIAGGGGILIVTLLMLLDTPIKLVIGTNRFSALLDNATSAYNYNKKGKVNKKFLKYAALPSLIGTFIGSKFLSVVDSEVLEKLIPVILIALVVHSSFSKKMGLESNFQGFNKKNIMLGSVVTFFIGIYTGFFGLAAGSFFSLSLVYVFKFDFLEAVATVKPLLFLMGITSVVFYAANGLIDYRYAIFITVFRVVGSRFGSSYASEKGSKLVKPVFSIFCVLVAIKNIL